MARLSTQLWICDDVFEGAAMAKDALSDVWAQLAVMRNGRIGDFYFPWYVVEGEE